MVLTLAYGYEVAGNSDEYVHLADEALKSMGRAGLLGTYYVVSFSVLFIIDLVDNFLSSL